MARWSGLSRFVALLVTLSMVIGTVAGTLLLRERATDSWRTTLVDLADRQTAQFIESISRVQARLTALALVFEGSGDVTPAEFETARNVLELTETELRPMDVGLVLRASDGNLSVVFPIEDDPLLGQQQRPSTGFHFPARRATDTRRITPTLPQTVDSRWVTYLLKSVTHRGQPAFLVERLDLSRQLRDMTRPLPTGLSLRLSVTTPQRGEGIARVISEPEPAVAASSNRFVLREFSLDSEWQFDWHYAPDSLGGPDFRVANLILIAGLTLSVLVVTVLANLIRRGERDRRRAQERAAMISQIQEKDARFRDLVQEMPVSVYRCSNDEHWTVRYISNHIEKLSGYSPDQLIDNRELSFSEIMHPDDRAQVAADVLRAVESGQQYALTYRIRHRNQGIRWVRDIGRARNDENGHPNHLDGVLFDISLYHHTEEMLLISQQRLAALVDHLDIGVVDVNLGNVVQSWNPAAENMFGYSPFDIVGRDMIAMLVPEDHRTQAVDMLEAFARGSCSRETLVTQNRPGKRLICEVYGTALRDPSGQISGLTLAIVDITERTEAQDALRSSQVLLERRVQERTDALQRANRELESAMKQLVDSEALAALGSMVAGVAHELNTPLGNAYTAATALRTETLRLAEHYQAQTLDETAFMDFLNHAQESTAILERAIERSVDLTKHFKRLAVDQSSTRRREFNVRESIDNVLTTLRPTLKRSPHVVDVDVGDNLVLDSYPGPFDQMVTNLVMNAIHHAFEGIPAGHITLAARLDHEVLTLTCTDNGVGMPTEVATRVFEPFFSTRVGQGGSGLGMYIIQTLVTDIMGGQIQLDTTPGKGTCFTVTLPRVAPQADGTLPPDTTQDSPPAQG